jgi:transcriptional regulator with XRE-family HTH domain
MQRVEQRRWGKAKLLVAGQMIRQLREAASLTPKQLCSQIGMTLGQLSDIERGIQHISLRRAYQVATVLKHSFADVVSQILQERLDEAGFRYLRVQVVVVEIPLEEVVNDHPQDDVG